MCDEACARCGDALARRPCGCGFVWSFLTAFVPGVLSLAYGGIGFNNCSSWEMPVWLLIFGIGNVSMMILVWALFARMDVVNDDDDEPVLVKLRSLFCHDFIVPWAGLLAIGILGWNILGAIWLVYTDVNTTCPKSVSTMALAAVIISFAYVVLGFVCLVASDVLSWLENICCKWAIRLEACHCMVRWCCPALLRRLNRKSTVKSSQPTSQPTGAAAPRLATPGGGQPAQPFSPARPAPPLMMPPPLARFPQQNQQQTQPLFPPRAALYQAQAPPQHVQSAAGYRAPVPPPPSGAAHAPRVAGVH